MSSNTDPRRERALDLLADQALYGSSPALEAELAALRASGVVHDSDLLDLESTAASLHMLAGTVGAPAEPLPPHLRAAILQNAPNASAPARPRPAKNPLGATVPMLGAPPREVPAPIARPRSVFRAPSTWLAMAACLLIGLGVSRYVTRPPVDSNEVLAEVTPAQARSALLASVGDAVTLPWKATEDPAAKGAQGDVVWSKSAQRGFLRFSGLAANDPKRTQYQLWIFDGARDQAYPVDGGVFDVPSGGEVIVPIDPRVPVTDATLFAVTVEAPGGVVVSKRERIVTTAAPSKG